MTPDDRALVDRFLDMMAAEAGSSTHTLAAYRNDLAKAAENLGSLGAASADDLSRLGAAWADLSPATVARRDTFARLPRRCGARSVAVELIGRALLALRAQLGVTPGVTESAAYAMTELS